MTEKTEDVEAALEAMNAIQWETVPREDHNDPGALEDCADLIRETLRDQDDEIKRLRERLEEASQDVLAVMEQRERARRREDRLEEKIGLAINQIIADLPDEAVGTLRSALDSREDEGDTVCSCERYDEGGGVYEIVTADPNCPVEEHREVFGERVVDDLDDGSLLIDAVDDEVTMSAEMWNEMVEKIIDSRRRGSAVHADEPEGEEDNPFGASDEELENAFGGPRPEEGRSNRGRPDPTDEPVSREGEREPDAFRWRREGGKWRYVSDAANLPMDVAEGHVSTELQPLYAGPDENTLPPTHADARSENDEA